MSKNDKVGNSTVKVNKPLTIRQLAFVKAYFDTGGNGTESVMKVYKLDNRDNAAAQASVMIRNPKIKELIDRGMTRRGLTVEQITGNIEKIAETKIEKPSAKVVLNANISLLKILGAMGDGKQAGNTTNVQINVENMNYLDIQKQLKTIDDGIKHLMSE